MVLFTAPALPAEIVSLPSLPATTATVRTNTTAPNGWTEYQVKGGDTLIGLAAIFTTSPGELAAHNNLANPRALRAGSTILVPRGDAASTGQSGPAATADPAPPATAYTVKQGDTLWSIAASHSIGLPSLVKANGLNPRSHIHPGQVLQITTMVAAAQTAPAKPAPAPETPSAHRQSDGHDTVFPGGTPAMSKNPATNRAALASATVPSRSATRDLIVATASQHGVDPKLALAISMQESGWNQRNVSGVNAIGAMQVIPAGGQWAEAMIGRDLNLLDTRDNVTAGVVMLRTLGSMATSEDEVVAAYYQGFASVRSKGWFKDTHFYVRSVKALKDRV